MKLPLLVTAALAAALCVGAPTPARAVEAGEKLWIHGYGNWAYGLTDGNTYMNGDDEGNYDFLEFSLAVSAEPAPRTSIHAQIFAEKEEGTTETSVDFAFAEYAFDPRLKFRIGAVKQPFGIFTEIFDAGILYPFVSLAQGVYGPAGIVTESYLGAGITGQFGLESGWGLQYDLYGGEMESALSTPWADADEDELEETTDIQDMVGGRILATTPGQSLTCGLSAYTGQEDTERFGEDSSDHRHSAYGAQAEYFAGPATLRAEYVRAVSDDFTSDAAYAEASWKLSPNWLVAARYDWGVTDLDEGEGVADSLLEQQDLGLAVNYFFSPNFVLKLAVHQVTGNRFTSVDDEDEEQDEKTTLLTVGTSFSF